MKSGTTGKLYSIDYISNTSQIFHPDSIKKTSQQQERNPAYINRVIYLGLLPTIPGRYRHIYYSATSDIQLHEQMVTITISSVYAIEVDFSESVTVNGGISILRVTDSPVSRSYLRQYCQNPVAEEPPNTHSFTISRLGKAIALGIVGFLCQNRSEKRRKIPAVHLVITGHDHHNINILCKSLFITGNNSAADTEIPSVTKELDSLVSEGSNDVTSGIGAGVIDYVDTVRLSRHIFQGLGNKDFLIISRNDYCKPFTLKHKNL